MVDSENCQSLCVVTNQDTHVPDGICLVWVKLEVIVGELQRRPCVQSKVCPAVNELGDCLECVQCQTIITIVGHVGHEHRHLHTHTDIQIDRQT